MSAAAVSCWLLLLLLALQVPPGSVTLAGRQLVLGTPHTPNDTWQQQGGLPG